MSKAVTPVIAAGGVLYKEHLNLAAPEVALIFRRGVWDLPKGKREETETIEECAVREVAEETGLSSSPKIIDFLTETYHEYERGGKRYGKTTYWFVMQIQEGITFTFVPEEQEGIEKVEWQALPRANKLVGYENLVGVLDAFEHWYS